MEKLEVEVCENSVYYKAFVTDVFNDGVLVAFQNDWRPVLIFPFSQVFLPRPRVVSSTEYTENQEVEIFSRLNKSEKRGWWKAVIQMTSGEFYLVKYERNDKHTEIVTSNRLRPKSNNLPIDHTTFHKFEIEVPEELREHAKMDNIHKSFQKDIKAEICRYSPDSGVLIVISRNEQSRNLSEMLQEIHFRNLGEKVSLLKIIDEQQTSIKLLQGTTKMIEKGEKLFQEKEKILSFAECPVCSDYMTAPISQCTVGHSTCNDCQNKLETCPICNSSFNSTRNYTLEKIIENISFPCSNAEFGCEAMIFLNGILQHSKICEYRLYDCLPGRKRCGWQGRRQDILTHMEQEHKELIWKEEINDVKDFSGFYFVVSKWRYNLICAHDEIFWLQRYMDLEENMCYISVRYIGPKENCEKYVYKLSFISSSDPQKNITFSMRTHPDQNRNKDIKEKGCFFINKCLADNFTSGLYLCYKVEIIKMV